MKNRLLISASWCVTAFILAGGGVAGWRNHQAIARERAELERLEADASSGESLERGGRSPPSMQARLEVARDFAGRLIKHWDEVPPKKEQGDEGVGVGPVLRHPLTGAGLARRRLPIGRIVPAMAG